MGTPAQLVTTAVVTVKVVVANESELNHSIFDDYMAEVHEDIVDTIKAAGSSIKEKLEADALNGYYVEVEVSE